MIRVKSLFEPVHVDDGVRIWVEPRGPIGLTLELIQSCGVDAVLPRLDPLISIGALPSRGFSQTLASMSQARCAELVALSARQQVTLLYEDSDPACNAASVLLRILKPDPRDELLR